MDTILRDAQPPEGARGALVRQIRDMVLADLEHWESDFRRMKANRKFARGLQWPGTTRKLLTDPDRPYVANITMRHLKQRTAATYARNPKFIWRRAQRLYHKVWDGTAATLQQAILTLQANQADPMATALLTEAAQYAEQQRIFEKQGETLAILYEYYLREQTQPTKRMMKRTVLQAGTCGVGYVKQTFQRKMQPKPEVERQIADAQSQLDQISRISQELQTGDMDQEDPEVARLQLLIAELEKAEQIMLREGLVLDYPDPLNIIPSKELVFLPGFLGCPHVTERFFLTKARVMEVYGVDLGDKFTAYRSDDAQNREGNRASYSKVQSGGIQDGDCACVFEVYNKADGLIYVVCDGYDDFLREPESPFPWTERFWPWFVYAPNAMDDPENPFPPSDVELIEPMQMEINRAGESLRDHRWAARPGHVVPGSYPDTDRKKMEERAPHSVIALEGMQPGDDVKAYLQPFPASPIDPNLTNTGPAMQDMLRVSGTQEANLGPTSDATATEASIAQSSRQSTDDSSIDELDDLLSEMARSGGQILLLNVQPETVMTVVGPGAVWPTANRETAAAELYLEVEAGSSGRPNQAHEVQVRTQMYPLLFQLPGLSAEKMAKDMMRVMDARMNYEDFVDVGALSVVAANGAVQGSANRGEDPNAQGPAGSSNAPTPQSPGQEGPQPPTPGPIQ